MSISKTNKKKKALLIYKSTDGKNANFTNGEQQALGRNPTDFSDYVRKTAANGAWSNS